MKIKLGPRISTFCAGNNTRWQVRRRAGPCFGALGPQKVLEVSPQLCKNANLARRGGASAQGELNFAL